MTENISTKSIPLSFMIKTDKEMNLDIQIYFNEEKNDSFNGKRSVITNANISNIYKKIDIDVPINNNISELRIDLGSLVGKYDIKDIVLGNNYRVSFINDNLKFSSYLEFEKINEFEGKFVSTGVDPYFYFDISDNQNLKITSYVDSKFLMFIYKLSALIQNQLGTILIISVSIWAFIFNFIAYRAIYPKILTFVFSFIAICYLTISNNVDFEITHLDTSSTLYKILKNQCLVIFTCSFLLFFACSFKKYYLNILFFILYIASVFILLTDTFSQIQFNTHIQPSDFVNFGKDGLKSLDIINQFVSTNKLIILLYLIAFIIILGALFCRTSAREKVVVSSSIIFSLVFVLMLPHAKTTLWESMFTNIFENSNASYNSLISYSADYRYSGFSPSIMNIKGLDQRKNIIIVMTESLSASESKLLGGQSDTLKNLDVIAKDNTYFSNYFSNGFNTDTGNFAFLTGKPYIFGVDWSKNKHYENSFIKAFSSKGYKTKVIYTASEIGYLNNIWKKSGFEEFFDGTESVYNTSERLAFGSVPDDIMFDNVISKLDSWRNDGRFLAMVMTTTTHSPYTVPVTHEKDFIKTLEYVDNAIFKFYQHLIKKGFFDDGILIITGDHRAMVPYTSYEQSNFGNIGKARVPFIIVGLDKQFGELKSSFSHMSAGLLLEYLNLNDVNVFEYQSLPKEFTGLDSCSPIFYQNRDPADQVYVYQNNSESTIVLNGDSTKVVNLKDDSSDIFLKYLYWFRKN